MLMNQSIIIFERSLKERRTYERNVMIIGSPFYFIRHAQTIEERQEFSRLIISSTENVIKHMINSKNIANRSDVSLLGINLSGAQIVPIVADHLKLPFALARRTKNMMRLAGDVRSFVIMIDDLIDTGKTIEQTRKKLKRQCKSELSHVILMYDYHNSQAVEEGMLGYVSRRENNIDAYYSGGIPVTIVEQS